MDYKLELSEVDGYVLATLGGVRTPEALMSAAEKITAFCLERSILRALADVRQMTGALDTLETFDVAGHGIPSQEGVRHVVRTAVIDRPENLDRIRFFETVATNRGVNLKVFDNEDQAIRWLHDTGSDAS